MNDEQYIPQLNYELPKKSILDRPNQDYINDESNLKIIREYTKTIPLPSEPQKKKLWEAFRGFINPQANLTFFERRDKDEHDMDMELQRLYFLMSLKPGEYTPNMGIEYLNCRQYAKIIFFRSVGISPGRTNERIAQQTSVSQIISGSMNTGAQQSSGNFISRIIRGK